MSKSAYTVATQNRFAELLSDADSDQETSNVPRVPAVKSAVAATDKSASVKRYPRESAEGAAIRKPRPERRVRPEVSAVANSTGPTGTSDVPSRLRWQLDTGDDDQAGSNERPRRTPVRGGMRGGSDIARRGGQRPFDRRSGTGRGSEMKRSGAGGHNWGNDAPDFGAEGAGPIARAVSDPMEAAAVDVALNGGGSPAATGSGEALPPVVERPEKVVGFADYERSLKQQRQYLNQQQETGTAALRAVDPADLEKEGYQKYEREETAEERIARELRSVVHDEDEIEEPTQRSKTYHLSEFMMPTRGRRGDFGGRGGERAEAPSRRPDPMNLDLADASAFPTLG